MIDPIDGSMVHALHRHWKPTKQGAAAGQDAEPIRIRIHRCLSWMQRVEDIGASEEKSLDAAIIFQWVALNSLYAKWNPQDRCPIDDRTSLDNLLKRLFEADSDGLIASVLIEHRRLVNSIFEDQYLSRYFWQDPSDERARKSRNVKFDARTWYNQGWHRLLLDRVLERIYLARCQLVHGAATHGSNKNRDTLRRCSIMLEHLLPAMLLVIMDQVWQEDWGDLCYPPMD